MQLALSNTAATVQATRRAAPRLATVGTSNIVAAPLPFHCCSTLSAMPCLPSRTVTLDNNRPSVLARAGSWPLPSLPGNIGEVVFEGAMGLMLVCLWGSLLLMSFQALSVYAANSGVTSAAVRGLGAIGPNPGLLFIRALAATLGVFISGVGSAAAAIPAVIMIGLRIVFVTIVGSLLHFS